MAVYPQHGDDPDAPLKNADIAMYIAKRGHLGVSLYSAENDHHTQDQLAVFAELRHAIDAGELVLFYQPQVNTSTGSVCGVEARVRWLHPTCGLLGHDQFISLAERSSLIRPLTNFVIKTALAQVSEWVAGGLHLRVSVNVDALSVLTRSSPAGWRPP